MFNEQALEGLWRAARQFLLGSNALQALSWRGLETRPLRTALKGRFCQQTSPLRRPGPLLRRGIARRLVVLRPFRPMGVRI